MTDQLREALAWWERMKGQTRFRQPIYVAFDAARWKLEFPTDAQVEAAARLLHDWLADPPDLIEFDDEACDCKENAEAVLRAALEAAHNAGKDER